ncbi:two-component sensor histidine kinase DegS [Barrientosiimonas marina]|uniref:Signal transduction histidine-protein kinase/phosphatase DegS n=1 Tax=Lentibacillus kimchii TaxID=1542911 RepID=A0ABW2V0G3_9BACI
MARKPEEKTLDNIIEDMINVTQNSKDEIFDISEEALAEYEKLQKELEEIRESVKTHITNGDELETKVQYARQRLAEVSKQFNQHSEEEIRSAYEQTHKLQTQLAVERQEEKVLREKRDELERRLKSLDKTLKRSEDLASKISVIFTYLTDDFQQVNEMIEDAKEKQEFGLKIIESQEDERRKISREIHDGPAQMLANILLRSELVDRTFRQGTVEEAVSEMKSVRKMIRSSLQEVRRIIYDLRPMALDDLGLVPTIQKFVATTAEYYNLDIRFNLVGQEERIHHKYEIAFFRLMQEALQNAISHAEASSILVKLEMSDNRIVMVIKDDGKGFDQSVKRDKSFGLMGMRERVEMLDGSLTINSEIGKGTTVLIKVPYPKSYDQSAPE